jgi:hypothetical protein
MQTLAICWLVLVPVNLDGGLGELRPVGRGELLHRTAGVILVLGVPDLGQGLLRARVRGLRQRAEHVGDLVKPAAPLRADRSTVERCGLWVSGPGEVARLGAAR